MGMKYCPSLDIELPVYKHMEYKSRHSAKQNYIFKLDTDSHILETQITVHIKPDPMVMVDVDQPGGGDGHGGQ